MKYVLGVLLLFLLSGAAGAQTRLPSYHDDQEYQFGSAAAYGFGLNGYDNPALLGQLHQPDLKIGLTSRNTTLSDLSRWGLFAGAPGFGFGFRTLKSDAGSVTDYRIATGSGNRSASAGFSVGWSGGDTELFRRSAFARLGFLFRPGRFVSIGLLGSKAFADRSAEGVADLGFRPFGTEVVTLYADYAVQQWQQWNRGAWSLGAVLEPVDGVRIGTRLYDTRAWNVGVSFSVGRAGVTAQNLYSRESNRLATNVVLRLGSYDRTFIDTDLRKKSSYVTFAPKGRVAYQRAKWLDDRPTLLDLLRSIDAARTDPRVSVVAINTSRLSASRQNLWEVRQALADLKTAGKKVLVYLDRADLDLYHFASIADRVVMDPLGSLLLTGYVSGRTFLKGTLEKVGIGFDEWRFFTYKAANESLSRDSMSAADREQRARLVEQNYGAAKADICAARGLSPAVFDTLINREGFFLAGDALDRGLVDTLSRWDAVKELARDLGGSRLGELGADNLLALNLPTDDRWGEPPTVAVVYALGVCDMDMGIRARTLSRTLQNVVDNPRIRAIVLRIDSPGGDALAADYVAEVVRKAKGKKPVIVSQGSVAASGGYWLSMYADTIVSGRSTITGSIGVAGGWLYNKGLKEWLGMSTDLVKAGDHADFAFGARLPFLGVGLPDRNLTTDERARVERWMKRLYADFVRKVGAGRETSPETIEKVAQGRVWSGADARERGLVDIIGGLETAIHVARASAGIPPESDVVIREFPEPPLLNLGALLGQGRSEVDGSGLVRLVAFLKEHNGRPLPILSLEDLDMDDVEGMDPGSANGW